MKKIRYVLASLLAIISLAAHAQQTEVSTYDELTTAINDGAASIKLTADISGLSSAISVTDKTLEIDFDGHTVTGASSFNGALDYILDISNSNVTVKNLKANCYNFGRTQNTSSMTLSNCTINASYTSFVDWNYYSQLNINNSTISGSNTSSIIRGFKLITLSGACEITNNSSVSVFNEKVKQVKIKGGYELYYKHYYNFTAIDVTQKPMYWSEHLVLKAKSGACQNGAHTMEIVGTPSTCTTGGDAYYHCTKCNVNYGDAQGDWIYTYGNTLPALGHSVVEDAENHRVTCSRTGCTFEAPILTEGTHTGLTYAANSSYNYPLSDVNDYTTLYYFKATGTGTLTITDSDGNRNSDDTYGALFNADMSQCLVYHGYNSNSFKLIYNVTEGQVYWIGARAFSGNTEFTNHSLTIVGAWPHPIASATITDGEAYDGSLAYKQAAEFTYKRTFTNNDWNCLYVPFKADVTAFTDCDIYTINMFQEHDSDGDGILDELTLEVNKAISGKILPNHPYLIKYRGNDFGTEKVFTFQDVYIDDASTPKFGCTSMSKVYDFYGTYSTIDVATATNGNYYTIIQKDGKHVIGKTTTGINPQRWYMTMRENFSWFDMPSSPSQAKFIRIISEGEDEETTGIADVNVYDNANSGKYLKNGKVVIIKNGKKYSTLGVPLRR